MTGKPNIESTFLFASLICITSFSAFLVPLYGLTGGVISVFLLILLFDLFRYFYIKMFLGIRPHNSKLIMKAAVLMTYSLILNYSNFFEKAALFLLIMPAFCLFFRKEIASTCIDLLAILKNKKVFIAQFSSLFVVSFCVYRKIKSSFYFEHFVYIFVGFVLRPLLLMNFFDGYTYKGIHFDDKNGNLSIAIYLQITSTFSFALVFIYKKQQCSPKEIFTPERSHSIARLP